MSESCRVPTSAQRQYLDVQDRAERATLATICKALEDAAKQAAEELQSTEFRDSPPSYGYFAAAAHQKLFVLLCGGDPETLAGGDPDIAARILDNGRQLSDHYWAGRAVPTDASSN